MRLILAAILVSAGCAQFERYEVGADDPVVIRVDVAEVATLDAPAADVALADAAVEVIATVYRRSARSVRRRLGRDE